MAVWIVTMDPEIFVEPYLNLNASYVALLQLLLHLAWCKQLHSKTVVSSNHVQVVQHLSWAEHLGLSDSLFWSRMMRV